MRNNGYPKHFGDEKCIKRWFPRQRRCDLFHFLCLNKKWCVFYLNQSNRLLGSEFLENDDVDQ
jgi:hypothetical protein